MSYSTRQPDPRQIARIDGTGCFIEIMSSMFDKDKVVINVEQHQPTAPHTRIAMNTFYLSFVEWLNFAKEIELGITKQELMISKRNWENSGGQGFAKEVKKFLGGTPRERLAIMGKSRPSGLDEYRELAIAPGLKADVVLSITTGDGQQIDGRIISSKINYKDKSTYTRTMVPLSYSDLRGVVLLVNMRIQAFITAETMKGTYQSTYVPSTPVPEYRQVPQSSSPEERNQQYGQPHWDHFYQNRTVDYYPAGMAG